MIRANGVAHAHGRPSSHGALSAPAALLFVMPLAATRPQRGTALPCPSFRDTRQTISIHDATVHASCLRLGLPFAGVDAISSSCCSLIDSYIDFDGGFKRFTFVRPRLAASAAPAARCCAWDLAGMVSLLSRVRS
ncbi:hypothetical protein WS67_08325 [Burkholderia singularis]|uniref:Uncharacterized protein n=1 Tax=Burkholderia singularis TaxID=1503053 RepID=A0A103E5F8_9BURK|nr:hypothetical protein AQ611_17895 [Burkholderia sp. Bp7605]KVE28712.1 hypothetical protein WS67_08325 [Burkholderia singularis]